MTMLSSVTGFLSPLLDILAIPITTLTAFLSKIQTKLGPKRMPISYKIWDAFGLTPLDYHYYNPVFKAGELSEKTWTEEEPLSGVNFNTKGQLALLEKFNYNHELEAIPIEKPQDNSLEYYYGNNLYCSGDAEILYNVIRHFKPKRIIEIGCGFSTRMAKKAIEKNRSEGNNCEQICIEPYEAPWLEQLGVNKVIRERVENVPISFFQSLEENDILFIDSSHVIRTGGDVCYEYLRILPNIKKGVIVHIHDIFFPFEYPRKWLVDDRVFWNEQYLLQAFLAFNSDFEVMLGLNYLTTHHQEKLGAKCPVFAKQNFNHGASAFWMQRK